MDIVCEHCSSKFKVADEKVPVGKTISVPCPKCKEKITINGSPKIEAGTGGDASTSENVHSNSYDAAEKPFDFVEEEGKTALLCESDAAGKKTLLSALSNMEYHVTEAQDTQDALRNMRYHVYQLILVNESFDTKDAEDNGVLAHLERMPMEIRRHIFVMLISSKHRTMDEMVAFNKSVNMILNSKDMGDTEKILTRGIAANDVFYRVFKDSLKRAGHG